MTQEEKAKAYDELKVKAQELTEDGYIDKLALLDLFPELEESEDERIRKELIEFVKSRGGFKQEYIAWLEKQGKHAKFYDSIQVGDKVTRNKDGVLVNLSQLKRVAKPAEVQCEQKPVEPQQDMLSQEKYAKAVDECIYGEQKPADKVEPKFHKGEWVVTDKNNVVQIKAIENGKYVLENTMRFTVDYVDKCWRKWTIQDTKDGDVLVCKGNIKGSNGIKYERICLFNNLDNAFFTLTKTSNFVEEYDIDVNIDYPDNTVPATKEQKEILFMAIADAGYTFDFEKKELKKISQRMISAEAKEAMYDKPIWSKKDDNCLSTIIAEFSKCAGKSVSKDEWIRCNDFLNSLKDRVQYQPQQEWSEEDENRINRLIAYFEDKESFTAEDDIVYANWLKSLRPQNTWKPSTIQMNALESAIEVLDADGDGLTSLFEQLKKLRGE